MKKQKIARLAKEEADYQRLGIKKEIQLFEDGHRTNGKFGEYEWWYFDTKLDNGDSLVIIFYTQPVTASQFTYCPSMTLSYTKGGEHFFDGKEFNMKDCVFAKDRPYVKLGKSYIDGDLDNYTLHYETENAVADLKIKGKTKSWRPHTGQIFFDERDYFAWLPSVPEGDAEVTLTVNGTTETLHGTGYHDHNWGNKGMFWLMHHWYWGRAKIGDYQAITSFITAKKEYGYEHFKIFMLAKDGEKITDNTDFLTYTQTDAEFDPVTKKHYHKTLIYDYNDGEQRYKITYKAEDIIEYFRLDDYKNNVAAKASPLLVWLVKRVGLAPSYIRMTGTVTLERYGGEGLTNVAETVSSKAIWEQMYFGLDEDV